MALKIIFAGTPDFAVPSLQALLDSEHEVCAVYTQPDRPAGRGRKLGISPVKALALEAGRPIYQPLSLRDPSAQAKLKVLSADLMVVVAYGQILPLSVLQTPSLGCINVHASLLPRWRGAAPIQRAMLAGDTQTGITIMQMAEGLDTGAMLLQKACAISPQDTGQILHDRLAQLGASTLIVALAGLQTASLHPEIQDESQVTYAQKLTKAEGKINWAQSASQIERQVRALNPWPVTYTECGQHHLRIWQAEVIDEQCAAQPGKILKIDQLGIDVATSEGILRITKIQEAGGKPLNIKDFLNAQHEWLVLGTIFSEI